MQVEVNKFIAMVFSKFAFKVSFRTLKNQIANLVTTGSMINKNNAKAIC